MTDVVICVGSSCHIKGARRVVEELRQLAAERGMSGDITFSGSFCMGCCSEHGVCVTVNGNLCLVDPEHVEDFFNRVIVSEGS